jgi:hypothetical protein
MRFIVKQKVLLSILLGTAAILAQQPDQPPKVRHVIGLDNIKHNASGYLKIENGVMHFDLDKDDAKVRDAKVPVSSISDVFIGNETTQSGGTAGRVVKLAAPFGSGRALTLLLRTKVDILTVVFRGAGGDLHGAIFALAKGQGEPMRAQLVAAGAHSSAPPAELKERTNP